MNWWIVVFPAPFRPRMTVRPDPNGTSTFSARPNPSMCSRSTRISSASRRAKPVECDRARRHKRFGERCGVGPRSPQKGPESIGRPEFVDNVYEIERFGLRIRCSRLADEVRARGLNESVELGDEVAATCVRARGIAP